MQLHMVRRIISTRAHSPLNAITHNLTPQRASIITPSGRPGRIGPMPFVRTLERDPRADHFRSSIAQSLDRYESMCRSRLYSALLLSMMLFTGLAACGPASSDNAPNLGPRASVSGPALSKESSSPGNNSLPPLPQAVSPLSLASVNGTVPRWDKPPSKSAGTPIVETVEDKLLKSIEEKKSAALPVPDSIAKDFESPYARIRLQALDYWATQGTKAPLDPLLEALEDDDAEVRAKAAKIAEEQWGIKQELD